MNHLSLGGSLGLGGLSGHLLRVVLSTLSLRARLVPFFDKITTIEIPEG